MRHLFCWIFALAVGLPARAQTMSPAQKKAFAAQLHYHDHTVLPQVVAARQQLEPYLSAADKQQLARYRERMHRLALEKPVTFRAPSLHLSAQSPEREQQRRQGIALVEDIDPLVSRYDAPIRALLGELARKRPRWEQDLTDLCRTAGPPPASGPDFNLGQVRALERMLTPFAFLTLDPNHQVPPARPPAKK